MKESFDVLNLIIDLKNFQGIKYKKAIGKAIEEFSKIMPVSNKINALNYDDDAAYIDLCDDGDLILISTDGIRNEYTKVDPWGAGYYGVVVNVKDILAMGGQAIGLVNVICYRDENPYRMILDGIREGAEKFNVPVLGGHICPESSGENVSIAILGKVSRENIIRSSTAQSGERILYVADLSGRVLPTWKLGWDSTSMKSKKEIINQLDAIQNCFNLHIFNAGKDVSNAGLIGTIGMLCEASKVGAVIDLDKIECPQGVDLGLWLKMNPGFGFVFSIKGKNLEKCRKMLAKKNITVMDIGCVTESNKLELKIDEKLYTVWDFKHDSLYGKH